LRRKKGSDGLSVVALFISIVQLTRGEREKGRRDDGERGKVVSIFYVSTLELSRVRSS
jgi:hypothetical protein